MFEFLNALDGLKGISSSYEMKKKWKDAMDMVF